MKSFTAYASLALFGLFSAFAAGYLLGQSPNPPVALYEPGSSAPSAAREGFAPFWTTWNLVHSSFLEQPLDDFMLTEGAIRGMLEVLDDPYTRYLSAEHEAREREAIAGEYQGIGVYVEEIDGRLTVISPLPGSPAEAAGLLPGDILRVADGFDLTDLSVDEAGLLVRGPAGSTVELFVERNNMILRFSVARELIRTPSVAGNMLDDNIAYVRLNSFGDRTLSELEETLSELLSKDPLGLVLDVRRNPGGGLESVVDVADLFLSEGIVLVEQFGDGRERVLASKDTGVAQELPLVVLIDEGSASAAEVLAGAIQARQRGLLVGKHSFGKGTIQVWHSLSNGGGLKVTVARWLTPDKLWVQERGLAPDLIISVPEGTILGSEDDRQLAAAREYLLGNPVIGELAAEEG